MEAVRDSETPNVGNSTQLDGLAKDRYNCMVEMLKVYFQPIQIAVILQPFIEMGLLSDYMDISEFANLTSELGKFWTYKSWSPEMSESFQIMIMTRPELEGVKIVFGAHPSFSKLLDNSEVGSYNASGTNVRTSNPNMNDNNAVPSIYNLPSNYSYRKDKEELNDFYHNGDSDDELIVVPKSRDAMEIGTKTKYQIHSEVLVDRDEIHFVPIERRHTGVLYVLQLNCIPAIPVCIGPAFDLIRSVYCDDACILRLFARPVRDHSEHWIKEIYVQAHTWTNVSEKMLPCENFAFPISFIVLGVGQDEEIDSIKIKGVYLNQFSRRDMEVYIASDDFQPYDYGFCQNF